MRRRKITPWEAKHPLNGAPCPITNRQVYIEDKWKVTRPDYRLRTGILEPGVVLSLPAGHTRIDDTASFFRIMHALLDSGRLDAGSFVLVEDYTLHTGSDYEGRLTYITRMIEEIHPAGIIFITRSTSWKLSIKIGAVFYGSPFPIITVPSYRDALKHASDILGRPLDGQTSGDTFDRIDLQKFSISMEVISPSLIHVVFTGRPSSKDLSVIADFYQSLPHHPEVSRTFRAIHDFSAMPQPTMRVAFKIVQTILSKQNNNGESIAVVKSNYPGFGNLIRLVWMLKNEKRHLKFYGDHAAAIAAMRPESEIIPVFRDTLQATALEMLETIVWDKPGFEHLEAVSDPQLKPLALMLGAIKQDVDYYILQRQNELDTLEEMNRRARQLSRDIEQAFLRSEEDRRKAELLSEENFTLSSEITSSQKEVLLVLADYIDRRARFPAGTTRKLARFAKTISLFFGYKEKDRERLHDAILLIHTGYLAIPENEPNSELHCIFGGEVLAKIYAFIMQYAAEIARFHHEKWDGSGFPERLKGERIPFEARLIALADFIITSPTASIETALAGESGKAFDPSMVAEILHRLPEVKAILAGSHNPDIVLH